MSEPAKPTNQPAVLSVITRKLDDTTARRQVFGALTLLIISALLGVGLYLIDNKQSIGLAALIGAGTMVCGGFLGFLFGIPRSRSVQATDATYQPNTNLEQVSDWLTKIIIGVSLVEMRTIASSVYELVGQLKVGFDMEHAYPFVWALLIFNFFFGLISGYLITRVHLPLMFARADQSINDDKRTETIAESTTERIVNTMAERNEEAHRLVEFQLSDTSTAVDIDPQELKDAIAAAATHVKSEISFKARQYRVDREQGTPEKRAALRRAVPVFEALIADQENSGHDGPLAHSNNAQRAFVLLHTLPPEFEEVIASLDKAILVRDRMKDKGHVHYEFNRAVARIGLWRKDKKDDRAVHEAIRADLNASVPTLKPIRPGEHRLWVEEWMKERGVTDLVLD